MYLLAVFFDPRADLNKLGTLPFGDPMSRFGLACSQPELYKPSGIGEMLHTALLYTVPDVPDRLELGFQWATP